MSEIFKIITDDLGTTKITPEVGTYELVPDNHPALREVMPEFKFDGTFDANEIASKLVETAKKHNGIGLSANQCGVFERVFVIGTEHFQIGCINPKVIAKSEEVSKDNEGCLSFPALYVKVERPNWCDVEFYDETGTFKQIRMEGLTARCFLHELDHLNGIKFTDHAGPVALKLAQERQRKMIKQMQRISKNAKKLEKTK